MCVCVYVCIYIERERERQTEGEKDSYATSLVLSDGGFCGNGNAESRRDGGVGHCAADSYHVRAGHLGQHLWTHGGYMGPLPARALVAGRRADAGRKFAQHHAYCEP